MHDGLPWLFNFLTLTNFTVGNQESPVKITNLFSGKSWSCADTGEHVNSTQKNPALCGNQTKGPLAVSRSADNVVRCVWTTLQNAMIVGVIAPFSKTQAETHLKA